MTIIHTSAADCKPLNNEYKEMTQINVMTSYAWQQGVKYAQAT